MTIVIGTAGHIDHGKTSLLRALTGIDADRLPEERARGMTIDVGYAHLTLPDGSEIDFVDVPGHDRLVGNMLVGAGEIDAALLVVAADDGPRAQTREHLVLVDALGIADGIAVVTKTDSVPPERVLDVAAEVRTLLDGTTLRGIAVLAASASSGAGLDDIRAALVTLRDRVAAAVRSPEPSTTRLAIDRVFSVRGRGTVVTGTLRGAPIARGAQLRVVPGEPDATVRVREVQVHGRSVDAAGPGRVALNLATGDAIRALERGAVLTTDPDVIASDRLLVALSPVLGGREAAHDGLPADRTPIAVHLGTARVAGVVGRSGRDAWDLGAGEGSAVLRLDRPIAVGPGDPLVVRRLSPVETLAGGRVLDPQPPRGTARRRVTAERLASLAGAAGSAAWRDARIDLHGAIGGVSPAVAADVAAAIDEALVAAVGGQPGIRRGELVRLGSARLRREAGSISRVPGGAAADDGIVAARLERLIGSGTLARDGDRLRPGGEVAAAPSAELLAAMDRLVAALSAVAPPPLVEAARVAGCPDEGVRLLVSTSRIVRLADDLAWSFPAYQALAAQALAMAADRPLTPAAYRDATGTSRKYVMVILEDLDRRAILRRTADGHVPGLRAPRASGIAPSPAGARREAPAP